MTTFCWLPPESLPAPGVRPASGCRIRDLRLREVAQGAAAHRARSDERRVARTVQHEILRDREGADEAVLDAVLGYEADAGVDDPPHRLADQLRAIEVMLPRATFCSPTSASVNSVCPLPCTPAIARISPGRTSKPTRSTTTCPCSSATVRSRTSSPPVPSPADPSARSVRPRAPP